LEKKKEVNTPKIVISTMLKKANKEKKEKEDIVKSQVCTF
jgi:hypothetical protein